MSAPTGAGASRTPPRHRPRSPSAQPRRPRRRDNTLREVVIQRVVKEKEVGGSPYPMLTRANYDH